MIDPNTCVGAVTLKVADVQKSVEFYHSVIGLMVLGQTAESAALGTADRPLIYLRHLANGSSVPNATGLYHFALRVPTRQDLADWLHHYGMKDAPYWQGSADHGVSEAIYLSDPEGNGIEVYRDRPRSEWPKGRDGSLTMYTEALDLQGLLGEADRSAWPGMAPKTDMGHIHLKAADIATAKQFYVDTLGFDQIIELPNSALFVSAGGYHHHIGLNTWHSRQGPPLADDAYGLAEYEILFAGQDALDATLSQLKEGGVSIGQFGDRHTVEDPFQIKIVMRVNES